LRLKPKADSDGYLDGAWWPRSGKLTAELPDLLTVLTVRLGPIQRVIYDRASWSRVPRRLTVGNRAVQLDAHPFELGNTMYIYGSNGRMIVLRVIASTTSHDSAHTALMAAVAREPTTTLDWAEEQSPGNPIGFASVSG
jgi:hypothetical protein